jgi:hypothetical protein
MPEQESRLMGDFVSLAQFKLAVRPRGFARLADSVAKGENRTTLKISRKQIFGRLYCCKAP